MSNAELVRGFYDSLNRGDVATILAGMDDGVVFQVAEHSTYWRGEPFRGPDEVLENVFARIAEDFDDFRIVVERIVEAGDVVVTQLRYQARATATGQDVDAQAAHILDFADGKLVRFQQYIDTWQTAQVTGKVGQRQGATAAG